jgi:hypothetical protein
LDEDKDPFGNSNFRDQRHQLVENRDAIHEACRDRIKQPALGNGDDAIKDTEIA